MCPARRRSFASWRRSPPAPPGRALWASARRRASLPARLCLTGADAIVIQEDCERSGDRVTVREPAAAGAYVRPAGLDFAEGDVLLSAGRRLTSRDIGLAAAMNRPWLPVRRRPRVALLATGDEIALPGEPLGPQQIVSSSGPGLAALVAEAGGQAVSLGVAEDSTASLRARAAGAEGADILVTMGGASVGEHDLVQSALAEDGLEVDFWRIAMRPGKPLMFGRMGGALVLGLPGNPVSAFVCALLFLRPLIDAMLGLPAGPPAREPARLGAALGANDRREDYLRARLAADGEDLPVATPFARQDSSMLARFVEADALVVRAPHAPPAAPATSWKSSACSPSAAALPAAAQFRRRIFPERVVEAVAAAIHPLHVEAQMACPAAAPEPAERDHDPGEGRRRRLEMDEQLIAAEQRLLADRADG